MIAFLAFTGMLLAFGVDASLPAFDDISSEFGLTEQGLSVSLVGTLYLLGMAVGQLFYGPISDRFGRSPTLRVGLVLYGLGALCAAFAPTFGFLLAARLLWGIGAAGPFVLRSAIARDLFEGDRMARVVTLMTAVFLIGPILVPFVGQAVLSFASWPYIFILAVLLAGADFIWTLKFGETLAFENRRPLTMRPLAHAAGLVFRNRVTIGHIGVQTFGNAAFFIYLGSSQPIIDRIYGQGDNFPIWFGLSGVIMIFALLVNNRLLQQHTASRLVLIALSLQVAASVIGLVVTLGADGRPPFWVWLTWIYVVNALSTIVTPMASAIALQPMGKLAGTAAAIMGFLSLGVGALVAAFFDAQIDLTVTPMLVGWVLCGSLALATAFWARPNEPKPSDALDPTIDRAASPATSS